MKKYFLVALAIGLLVGCSKEAPKVDQPEAVKKALPFAHGKISYADARAIYDQLKQPVEETGVFNKRSMQDRQAYVKTAQALRDKVEPIFGVPSQCFTAATMRAEYASNLHTFASALEGMGQLNGWQDLTSPMRSAFMYGNAVAGCYEDVEALQ